jgi:NitT/TauT family transport system ATP-binding protein
MMEQPILSAKNISHDYPAAVRGSRPVTALRHVSLDIPIGQFCSVVGRSGCGKTTLLRILAGLLRPSSGQVTLSGERVTRPSKNLAVVFQDYSKSLPHWRTVGENVRLGLLNFGLAKDEEASRVENYLSLVGLSESVDKYPWQLSGGMQQRVAIARALARQPKVLLLDEPFGALDAPTRFELEDQLLEIVKKFNITTFMITHDIDEAVYVSDRVIVMAHTGVLDTTLPEAKDSYDFRVNLGAVRRQVETRANERFIELRSLIFERLGLAHGRSVLVQHV